MPDLIIRNARVVDALRDDVADVAVTDGVIESVAPNIDESAPIEVDANGNVLLAGLIDAHVHFNDPGRADWEGIRTGSQALAKGGVTSYFDMPLNSSPPTLTVEAFDAKRHLMDAQSLVNGYLWGGLTPTNLDDMAGLSERGVIGFKAFMSRSGTDDFQSVDDDTLYRGMQIAQKLGKIVAVHAENDSLTYGLAQQAIQAGRTGIRDYLESRPAVAEWEAIQRAILFAEETGCALHIVHVSTGRGVELVLDAQARDVDVTCETCPHYLVLTDDDVERLGAVAKCAPPLRDVGEQAVLWHLLLNDQLPIIASDHSPAPMDMKQGDDFFAIWGGIASCQSTLSLMLTYGYHQRGMSLQKIAEVTSYNVAQRFSLSTKGLIAEGMDADFTLVDVDAQYRLTADDLAYKHQVSPYVGMDLHGKVHKTWVGGKQVYG